MDPLLLILDGLAGGQRLAAGLGLLLVLILLSAVFSASEVALISFSRIRRRQLLEEGHPDIGKVERVLEHSQRFVIAILVWNTLTNVLAAALATVMALQVAAPYGIAPAWAVGAATIAVTLLVLAIAEIAPKAYAVQHAERLSLSLAGFLLVLERLAFPLVWVFEKLANAVLRRAGAPDGERANHFKSEEELKTLITLGTEEGIIEEEEEEMIHSVIEFADTTAKEIMVPRIDMTVAPGDATLEHVRAFVLDAGYTRIPVYQGTLDNVVGILYVKEMLTKLVEGKGTLLVREIMREPYFVPETKKLDDLLSEMRDRRVHMAVVIDEFGGTAGLLTLEDVLEEIVGDIFDEYDLRTDPIRRVDDRTAILDARTHVADVNDALDLEIPEDGPYDTVGGFIFNQLGRLGKEGEVIHHDTFDLSIEKVSNRRILRVRLVKKAPTEGEPPGAEATGGAPAERSAGG